MSSARDLRAECEHFRVLIIGRANAGKTTILRKVCGARADENPEILRAGGDKQVELQGSAERGNHDIEDELVFKSNPQFIFHDSEGFESGSTSQVEKVKEFIKSKSEGLSLQDQLHAIWCCLPTDTTRPLNGFEKDFFDKNVHGNVPVIIILTKYDGLLNEVYTNRSDRGLEDEVAGDKEGLEEDAKTHLKNYFHIPLHRLESDFLVLSDMHEENTECDELIAKTTNALTNDVLKLLLVSVQQNNINLCTFYAVKWVLEGTESFEGSVECILQWFPHFWWSGETYEEHFRAFGRALRLREEAREHRRARFGSHDTAILNSVAEYPALSYLLNPGSLQEIAQAAAVLCIIAEQSFIHRSHLTDTRKDAMSGMMHEYATSHIEALLQAAIGSLNFSDKKAMATQIAKFVIEYRHRLWPIGGE